MGKNKLPVNKYNLTIVSVGKFKGQYIKTQLQNKTHINNKIIQSNHSEIKTLPSSFSWQSKCTPVKDQGYCGACWAFAGCGTFESAIRIWDANVRDLSEQYLINCDLTSMGCNGGYCPHYLWVNNGAVYENDVPYQAIQGNCQPPYNYHEKALGTNGYFYPDDNTIKSMIYNYGPVWACVAAGTSNFMGYSGGILTTNEGSQIDHAIVLVGWKDTLLDNGSTGYWILRNSWGPYWGENGYMRIAYGMNLVGQGAVGVHYLDYKGIIPHVLTANFTANNNCGNYPLVVQFNNNSYIPLEDTVNSWLWDFGDGSTSNEMNPVHTYQNPGLYTVSLTVTTTSMQSNTIVKNGFVLVSNPATTYNMNNATITTCSGSFFDSGGCDNTFQSNEYKVMTFIPDIPNRKIRVQFLNFNLFNEPYQYLKVYDGISTNAPLINTYSGNNVPDVIIANNSSGALTFEFFSNEFNPLPTNGWTALIDCIAQNSVLTVQTNAVTNVTDTSVTLNGIVLDDGGYPVTVRGFCGGLSPNPTLSDFRIDVGYGTGTYSTNITGLTPNTTYHIRAFAINSIDTVYGNDMSFTTLQHINPIADFNGQPTVINAGGQVLFSDLSTGNISNYQWLFTGGVPPSATGPGPHIVTYNNPGTYDVSLTVDSPTNTMVKTNYITVNPAGNNYFMSNSIVTTCLGNFYDSGGPYQSYQNNENFIMTFKPDIQGQKIEMVFTSFELENDTNCFNDYLEIYDGSSLNAPLIGKFCGTIPYGVVSATNSEGALTYVFNSNDSINKSGWIAAIQCLPVNLNKNNNDDEPLIFPNPTSNYINFVIDEATNYEVEIYSIQGLMIKRYSIYEYNSIIDVSDFDKGIYLMKIKNKNNNVIYNDKLFIN